MVIVCIYTHWKRGGFFLIVFCPFCFSDSVRSNNHYDNDRKRRAIYFMMRVPCTHVTCLTFQHWPCTVWPKKVKVVVSRVADWIDVNFLLASVRKRGVRKKKRSTIHSPTHFLPRVWRNSNTAHTRFGRFLLPNFPVHPSRTFSFNFPYVLRSWSSAVVLNAQTSIQERKRRRF